MRVFIRCKLARWCRYNSYIDIFEFDVIDDTNVVSNNRFRVKKKSLFDRYVKRLQRENYELRKQLRYMKIIIKIIKQRVVVVEKQLSNTIILFDLAKM